MKASPVRVTEGNGLTRGEMAADDTSSIESAGSYVVLRLGRLDGEEFLIGLTAEQVEGLAKSLNSMLVREYVSSLI